MDLSVYGSECLHNLRPTMCTTRGAAIAAYLLVPLMIVLGIQSLNVEKVVTCTLLYSNLR